MKSYISFSPLHLFVFFLLSVFVFIISTHKVVAEPKEWSPYDITSRIFDIEYTPEELRSLRAQLKSDKTSLLRIFKENNPKLSDKEATKRFNKLYTSILKYFNAFVSDFEISSKSTTEEILKWMKIHDKEQMEKFNFFQLKRKFDIQNINQMLAIYKIKLTEQVTTLDIIKKSPPQNEYSNLFATMQYYEQAVPKTVNMIAFFECFNAIRNTAIGANIDGLTLAKSLFYLYEKDKGLNFLDPQVRSQYPNGFFHSKFLLAKAAQQGSDSANAMIALIYINEYLTMSRNSYLTDFGIARREGNEGPIFYNDLQEQMDAAIFYINNGAVFAKSAKENNDQAQSIGDIYSSQNLPDLAERWYQLTTHNDLDKEQNRQISSTQLSNLDKSTNHTKSSNFINYYCNSELLYNKGWDIADYTSASASLVDDSNDNDLPKESTVAK